MIRLLVERLKHRSDDDKADALMELAQVLDATFGEDAEALCEYLRVSGGVSIVSGLIRHRDPAVHQSALVLLANLSSNAVDPHAEHTKEFIRCHHAALFGDMLAHLASTNETTLMYAVGAIQNFFSSTASLPPISTPNTSGSCRTQEQLLGCGSWHIMETNRFAR